MGYIGIDELGLQKAKIEQKRLSLEFQIRDLKKALGDTETDKKRLKGIESYLQYVRGAIDTFKWEDKRDFLKRFLYWVKINPDGGVDMEGILDVKDLQHVLQYAGSRTGGFRASRACRSIDLSRDAPAYQGRRLPCGNLGGHSAYFGGPVKMGKQI